MKAQLKNLIFASFPAALTLLLAAKYFSITVSFSQALLLVLASALLGVGASRYRELPSLLVATLMACSIGAFSFGFTNTLGYGDTGHLESLLVSSAPFPRWLLGAWFLSNVFRFLGDWLSPETFVSLGGMLCFGVCLFISARRFRDSPAILLLCCTPIVLLNCSGYSEYYPFVSGFFILFLLSVLEGCFEKIKPALAGFLLSLFGLLYVGFLPLMGLILIWYLYKRNDYKERLICLAAFSLSFLSLISLCYGSLLDYPLALYESINTTSEFTVRKYRHGVVEGVGVLSPDFAFKSRSLSDRLFMLFFGAGPSVLVLWLCSIGFTLSKQSLPQIFSRELFFWIALLIFLETLFFIFMTPHLGRKRDLDLFTQVYLSYVIVGAYLCRDSLKRLSPILCAFNIPAAFLLLRGL